ncbi:hypothetical protein PAPYR_9768 [Paratrimastix pyriformis]|uniref:Uncharacterized protein n=1 Tax=Paratrimastix pyriformis TaxID=342808 RepID=A0ABQ8U983_9EUKA|nr:hypothetical protein PAPYR_9768 [Paratrimastix pyriformis]
MLQHPCPAALPTALPPMAFTEFQRVCSLHQTFLAEQKEKETLIARIRATYTSTTDDTLLQWYHQTRAVCDEVEATQLRATPTELYLKMPDRIMFCMWSDRSTLLIEFAASVPQYAWSFIAKETIKTLREFVNVSKQ